MAGAWAGADPDEAKGAMEGAGAMEKGRVKLATGLKAEAWAGAGVGEGARAEVGAGARSGQEGAWIMRKSKF